MALRNCVFGVLICCCLVGSCTANTYAEPYSCYVDVCNEGSDAQFCDEVIRHCRLCDEVRDDCFSRLQTCNCSQFCSEHKLRLDIEKLRVWGCQVPSPPEHGRYTVNTITVPLGATLTVICDAEYTVRNEHPMRCSNFSTWTGCPTTCEGSQTDWQTRALIAVVVILCISLVMNITCLVQKYRNKCLFKREKKRSQANNEHQPLMGRNKIESQTDINTALPSAPPMQYGIDVEGSLNNGNCRHDTNTATNPDKGHISYTCINSEDETSGIKNSSNASDGKMLFQIYVITGTPEPTNQSPKEPDGVAKQPDNFSVADQPDSKIITKSMGGSIPDASPKGPVVQPEGEGLGSWDP
ncbi:uncharacterized protein LOC127856020 isoform X2 [Dreissena polymorpha]|uniref:uncharacterized protein LOC127856020 isoform X2 n=1 Tax=Dreissena polymorpha TaxID=45954 RepID=UPI002263B3CD|nr:uncharacterized protein LOC127856020 isoform X2 [Dreissena polymorpha]